MAESPAFNDTPVAPKMTIEHPLNILNLFMLGSVILFVLAISFWVQTQNVTTTTKAVSQPPILIDQQKKPNYLKMYKDTPIPAALYVDAEAMGSVSVDTVSDYIQKYYLYGELRVENNLPEPPPVATFTQLHDTVEQMQQEIIENYSSIADFWYMVIPFSGHTEERSLWDRYESPQERATEILSRYQEIFVTGSLSPQQIIETARKDEEYRIFTKNEPGGFRQGYRASDTLFPKDLTFNTFLFSQPAYQVSDIHILKSAEGNPYALVIVFPTQIIRKKIDSIQLLLDMHKKWYRM